VPLTLLPVGAQEAALVADAGPDQTVPGPSPVMVTFNGSASSGDILLFEWRDEGGVSLGEGANPTFEVSFDQKMSRTFTLVIMDASKFTCDSHYLTCRTMSDQVLPLGGSITRFLRTWYGQAGALIASRGYYWDNEHSCL
jgi:hypothetical protein